MIMPTSTKHDAGANTSDDYFIGFVELWLPNEESTELIRVAAISTKSRQAASSIEQQARVGPGEGIAGAAWNQKSAIVFDAETSRLLNQFGGDFDQQLGAIVALPTFRHNEVRGVLVLGLTTSFGAAEVWSRDDRDELGIAAGHYCGLPSFEFITRYTRFPKGAGVPGAVWNSRRPKITQDLAKNSSFIRSFGNDPAEVSAAIGLPVGSISGFPACVVLLLQTVDSPLSRRTEVIDCEIVPATDTTDERVNAAFTTVIGRADAEPCEAWHQVLTAEVCANCAPVVLDANADSGAEFHVGWPVFSGNQIESILGLTF